MFFFDTTYLWYVFIPTIILSLGVQLYLKATVSKWSNTRNSQGLTGIQVGQALFQRTSLLVTTLTLVAMSCVSLKQSPTSLR
jgi:Zn-dependent membrane protease YugP